MHLARLAVERLGSVALMRDWAVWPLCAVALAVGFLLGWACVIAAIVLDGKADNFDPKQILNEVNGYAWAHTTADAVIAAFVASSD